MANEYGIPSTIDTVVLTTSLADIAKRLTDNIYNDNTVVGLLSSARSKKTINGGLSIC